MATPVEIQVIQTGSGNTLEQTEVGLGRLSQKVKVAGVDLEQFSRISQSSMAGVTAGILEATQGVGKLDEGTARLVDTGTKVMGALAFGGPLAAAFSVVGIVIGELIGQMQLAAAESKKTHDALVKPFIDTREALEKLTGKDNPLLSISRSIPITVEQLDRYARSTTTAADNLFRLNQAQEDQANTWNEYASAQVNLAAADVSLNRAENNLKVARMQGADTRFLQREYDILKELRDREAQHVDTLQRTYFHAASMANQLAGSVRAGVGAMEDTDRLIDSNTRKYSGWVDAQDEFLSGFRIANAEATSGTRNLSKESMEFETEQYAIARGWALMRTKAAEYIAETQKGKAALDALAHAASGQFKSAVDRALTPTDVTQEDLDLTAVGKYKDKWDEVRREWDAMAKGQGGTGGLWDDAAARLNALGMDAGTAAKKFKDFSLFADPANIDKAGVQMGVLAEDVQDQMDQMIGKFNLTQVATERVWDTLPQEKKDALAKMGLEGADDATKALLGLAPSKMNVEMASTFQTNLDAMKAAILNTIPPALSTTVYVTYQGVLAEGGGSGDTSGTVLQPGAPAPEMYADGGMGVFGRDQFIGVHRGESFWISGTRNQVPPPGDTINVTVQMGQTASAIPAYKIGRRVADEIRKYRR